MATFLAREEVQVSRMTKSGLRTFDARAAVRDLAVVEGGLVATIAHQVPLVRPDDLLAALGEVEPTWRPPLPPLLTRLVQGERRPDRGHRRAVVTGCDGGCSVVWDNRPRLGVRPHSNSMTSRSTR